MANTQKNVWSFVEAPTSAHALEPLEIDVSEPPASPVHALHQRLSTNFVKAHAAGVAPISQATKFSIVFYAGIGAWVALAIPVFVFTRIW